MDRSSRDRKLCLRDGGYKLRKTFFQRLGRGDLSNVLLLLVTVAGTARAVVVVFAEVRAWGEALRSPA